MERRRRRLLNPEPPIGDLVSVATPVVQASGASANTSATLTRDIPVGAWVFAILDVAGAVSSTGASDSRGNSYTLFHASGTNPRYSIRACQVSFPLSAGDTVTYTTGSATGGRVMFVLCVLSGIHSYILNSAVATNTDGSPTQVVGPLSHSNHMIIALVSRGTGDAVSKDVEDPDYISLIDATSSVHMWIAYRKVSSPDQDTYSCHLTASGASWHCTLAVLRGF